MGKNYRVMITSLYPSDRDRTVKHYVSHINEKDMYCSAMTAAEASCKYILANYHIDEIVALGSKSTYDPGDEMVRTVLREGSSFYTSDISELSSYSLLRYRLAQYIDEIAIDSQDIRALLSEEEQEIVKEALRDAFRKCAGKYGNVKFNRFFDMAANDPGFYSDVLRELEETLPETAPERESDFSGWIQDYLYQEMKDTLKLEALEGNEDVKIVFIPTDDDGAPSFSDGLMEEYSKLTDENGEPVKIEVCMCIQSEDADDTFTLINFMDITRSLPDSNISVDRIITSASDPGSIISVIKDNTEMYGTRHLLAGLRAFLKYGKTDLLMEYWDKHNNGNPYIEKMLYAMRNIDVGISLCDIGDIERGIKSLKKLFDEETYVPGDSIPEQYFPIIIDGVRQDYAAFLDEDGIRFIDLVKWAYKKGFWQQTLTLIESKAPDDFVRSGIYYYCDSEESKQEALRVFGTEYYNLKPHEKYKLDHISHYFIKFYGRWRIPRTDNNDMHQRLFTKQRIQDLDGGDEKYLRGFTLCSDRELLSGMLYAYYHLGDVRNATNHAIDETGGFMMKLDDSDVGERMNLIKETVDNFIYMYEQVSKNIEGSDGTVLLITNDEIKDYAAHLRREFAKSREEGGHK